MADRADEAAIPHDRSGLTYLLRRTPYSLRLRGCSVAGIQATDTADAVPRMYGVKVEDRTLTLRYWGYDPMNPTWSVKAHLEETGDGVLLTGRMRYLLDRVMLAMFVGFTAVFLAIAVGLIVSQGLDNDGYRWVLLGAAAPGALLLLHVGLFRHGMLQREARAEEILRAAYEGS